MPNIYKLLSRFVPQRFKLQYYIYRKAKRRGRPQEKLALRLLCDKKKSAVDVGANIGTIAYFLSKYSKATHAFEINPTVADKLERAKLANTTVHRIGLSDSPQRMRLRVPVGSAGPVFGEGTIEATNGLNGSNVTELEVPVSTLDSFKIPNVGIIKIDVEGHEFAVLRGAHETLKRDRPSLIVEIVERFNGNRFQHIIEYMSSFSYKCYRLTQDRFVEVTVAEDQGDNNDYYFLQEDVVIDIGGKLRAVLGSV